MAAKTLDWDELRQLLSRVCADDGEFRNTLIAAMHYDGLTLAQIGRVFDITTERVRQIVRREGVPVEHTKRVLSQHYEQRRKPTWIKRNCQTCGAEFEVKRASKKLFCNHCAYRKVPLDDDELIRGLRRLGKKLGHTPRQRDINNSESLPSHNTFAYRFGSLQKAQRLAGFNPNQHGGAGHMHLSGTHNETRAE